MIFKHCVLGFKNMCKIHLQFMLTRVEALVVITRMVIMIQALLWNWRFEPRFERRKVGIVKPQDIHDIGFYIDIDKVLNLLTIGFNTACVQICFKKKVNN